MARIDNLVNFLEDVASSIKKKKNYSDDTKISASAFDTEIESISGGGDIPDPPEPEVIITYTGHADREGLRQIGWTEEDIDYFQENGVNWNEEDDDDYKLTDEDLESSVRFLHKGDEPITLYYRDKIIGVPRWSDTYCPQNMNFCRSLVAIPRFYLSSTVGFTSNVSLRTISELTISSTVTSTSGMFSSCYSLKRLSTLNLSSVTIASRMFEACYNLSSVGFQETTNVTNMNSMFSSCYSLTAVEGLSTNNATDLSALFATCRSLQKIPTIDISNCSSINSMCSACGSLKSVDLVDTGSTIKNAASAFVQCYSLKSVPKLNMNLISSASHMFR